MKERKDGESKILDEVYGGTLPCLMSLCNHQIMQGEHKISHPRDAILVASGFTEQSKVLLRT